jgi:hypothetical protein
MSSTEKYTSIPSDEDQEGLLSGDISNNRRLQSTSRPTASSILLIIGLMVFSCLTSSLCGLVVGRRYPSDNGAIRHVSKYSPILDDVNMNFHTENFNGTFVHENIYRQDASPEVDAAWDALGVRCEYLTTHHDAAYS